MPEDILKTNFTQQLAKDYNFVPYDDSKMEDEHIEDEFRWCLLAKRKHACNVLIKYNSDELNILTD